MSSFSRGSSTNSEHATPSTTAAAGGGVGSGLGNTGHVQLPQTGSGGVMLGTSSSRSSMKEEVTMGTSGRRSMDFGSSSSSLNGTGRAATQDGCAPPPLAGGAAAAAAGGHRQQQQQQAGGLSRGSSVTGSVARDSNTGGLPGAPLLESNLIGKLMLKRLALALKLDEQRLGELLSGSVQVRGQQGVLLVG